MSSGDGRRRSIRARAEGTSRRGMTRRGRLSIALAVFVLAIAAGAMAAVASGGAPSLEVEHPASLGRTSAVLSAQVNPNGSPVSECDFEYGTSESALTSTAPCSYSPGELETPVPVSAPVEGLAETTTYYFRIHAKSSAGESTSAVAQFTTLPTAPVANTEGASSVGRGGATLNALITPEDSEVTECFFEYGTVPGELTSHVACSPAPGSGSEAVAVRASVSGLAESTVYYYRVVARNSFGLEHGGRTNFETLPSRPRANTESAGDVTHTTATLRGYVTPNGARVETCYFEWGSASVEENTTPCEPGEVGSGETPVAVSAPLSGLAESTNYHVRLVAGNSHGTTVGGGVGFTTLPHLPSTLIQRPAELSDESAVLRARINPQDEAVTGCRFEYGTTPALGQVADCDSLPGAGERYSPVSATVTGLSPTTTYLARVRAQNASGTIYSKLETFTTYKPGLLPVVHKIKPAKGSSAGGTVVTVKGEDLEGASAVVFGETVTTDIISDTPDTLTVLSPGGVGTVDVIVVTESGESQISSADHFTYGKPTIVEVTPNHGPTAGGTEVTVTGSGFEPGDSGTTFLVGKNAAASVECLSSTVCTMIVPPAYKGKAATDKVTAHVGGKGSAAAPGATFSYET